MIILEPITIGYNYAALVHVDLGGPSTWATPFALERTPTAWSGVDLVWYSHPTGIAKCFPQLCLGGT
jgi:hypothetical protein